MALNVNGTHINNIYVNGIKMQKVVCDGITIYAPLTGISGGGTYRVNRYNDSTFFVYFYLSPHDVLGITSISDFTTSGTNYSGAQYFAGNDPYIRVQAYCNGNTGTSTITITHKETGISATAIVD